jgi:hypothetical protein
MPALADLQRAFGASMRSEDDDGIGRVAGGEGVLVMTVEGFDLRLDDVAGGHGGSP